MSASEIDPTVQASAFAKKFGADAAEQFGANEWLVDEMYERYQADPNSVDGSWIALFSSIGSGPATSFSF